MRQERLAAFEEFAQVNGDSLVRLSFALCGDRWAAEDAVQEALTGVYLRWGRLDDPLPYARRAVVNATNDQWRRLLTSYQTTVLAKAHVTKANLAVLKKMHLTPLQIKALGVAYRTAQQIAGAGGSDKQLTVAQIAAVMKVKPTVAQIAALGYANLTVAQIEAIAKADLTAAQLAALGG